MDIELLSRMIGELIVENDQVGLPGVGTFVAEVVPASFSDKGYTINPPYRRLIFHANYLGDTVLSDFYAETNNIDKETSSAFIKQYLQELNSLLLDKKTINLPGLGRLRATKENNVFFIQDEEADIFPDGFALVPVSLKSHVEPEVVELSVPLSINADDRGMAAPAPSPAPSPVAEPSPAPIQASATPEPEPEQTQAEPAPEPEPVPAAEPVKEPVFNDTVSKITEEICNKEGAGYVPVSEPKSDRRGASWWKLLIALVLVIVLFVGAYMVLARVAPDIVDSFLYTEEELRIINY